ncbi:NAD-dependent succinate-semialdehyde dehydrogenase [Pleomorphomonas diazotrophica]|uniref:NAD-dependent succinate-semialdehyde dehydrogenase n=1 Tax=Pleomorphomonas diazotrophica TaxID=1166257 RepID=A0A1I4V4V8_9HYPH|nr:NAD-dependent succinate-semialdehyde dehydrogenase [Pleomorphomonas diazotrophica]PKR87451.1 NAD-dependent succinate-semialdehyde dehydrogenase [Pleomorphomonas diazotrophica]SFM96267.1 succinate-semialdehyde dehydrogenase / glutarate-semialdehyde dehydrogenase [Pleomorphomonas diazotrophica]
MTSMFQLLIDGTSREGSEGKTVPVVNPATGETFGDVAYASARDLDEALSAATRGLMSWQAVPPWERGRILKDAARRLRDDIDRIAHVITREQGKPLAEARVEIERSADFLEWGGEEARRIAGRIVPGRAPGQRIEIQPHPIGVVAAFTPWNFSMALAAKKFAGALGAGCSIICKPSQETPGSVIEMARALLAAGVHPAAIAVVFGEADQVSTQLIHAPEVAKITFTGSIPIGKRLAAAAGAVMKPVTMELGGHAPVIVCGDVDPEATAELLVEAKFMNAGQICLCPSRFFVEASIAERFTARFVELAAALRVGDGADPETQMGPLANERRVAAIAGLVEDARTRGATILTGGRRIGERGNFYAPTVLTDVPPDAAILHEEPFGPVAPILPFTDEAAMLAQANGLEFGLSSYVFTRDEARLRRLVDALRYGVVGVNGGLTHQPEAPLGGWKESGIDTEGGIEILDPYQITKHVNLQ